MLLFELVGWIDIVLAICGLVICLLYSRLSARMVWLVLAFGISAGAGIVNRLTTLGLTAGFFARELSTAIYALAAVGNLVAAALLVFGLLGLFRELRERFQFMREAWESQHEQPPARDPPGRESIFGPSGPAQ